MDGISDPALAALTGAFGGLLLGLGARLGRFCTLGAIEDALYGGSFARLRMWALALGVAIAGTFFATGTGLISIESSIYAALEWNPLASIAGGLIFGYGMAISGNCGFGALARLGGGDMRSFVIVVVMGVVALMTVSGPLAHARLWLFPPVEASGDMSAYGFAHMAESTLGLPKLAVAVLVAIPLVGWALVDREFRRDANKVFWSLVVATAILSGWIGTTWVADLAFDPVRVQSHTFTAPVGESILYLMTSTGGGLGFAEGAVAGVVVGAVIGSFIRGQFHWEACEDPRELGRQALGGALMGFGAVVSLGCSVGQGLTAFSTLYFGAPVTLMCIFLGAALGLRQLIHGFMPGRA